MPRTYRQFKPGDLRDRFLYDRAALLVVPYELDRHGIRFDEQMRVRDVCRRVLKQRAERPVPLPDLGDTVIPPVKKPLAAFFRSTAFLCVIRLRRSRCFFRFFLLCRIRFRYAGLFRHSSVPGSRLFLIFLLCLFAADLLLSLSDRACRLPACPSSGKGDDREFQRYLSVQRSGHPVGCIAEDIQTIQYLCLVVFPAYFFVLLLHRSRAVVQRHLSDTDHEQIPVMPYHLGQQSHRIHGVVVKLRDDPERSRYVSFPDAVCQIEQIFPVGNAS